MTSTSSSDVFILALGVGLAAIYLFRDQLFAASKPKTAPAAASKAMNGSGNPRDFVAKMKETVCPNLAYPQAVFFSSML
jgi:NADPH-ferrihemoprotein reductase